MKKFVILIICIIATLNSFAQKLRCDVIQYEMDLCFNKKLNVDSRITLIPNDSIILFNFPNNPEIKKVINLSNGHKFAYSLDSIGNFSINIPASINYKDTLLLKISYSIEVNSFDKNPSLFFYWFPYQKDNLAKYEVNAILPEETILILPGERHKKSTCLGNKKKFIQKIPINNYPLVISKKGTYNTHKEIINNIKVSFYFTSEYNALNKIIEETKSSFVFYSRFIGEYLFSNLNLIEIPKQQFINSQPSFILIGSIFVEYFDYPGMNEWVPHEVGHQWVGSGMFLKSDDSMRYALFEPLTEYLKLMYLESRFGKDSLQSKLENYIQEYKDNIINTEKDIPIIEAKASRIVYIKGSYIMHLVRSEIGDENWRVLLETLYGKYKGCFFTVQNFINHLAEIDKATAIKFNKWVRETGMPTL